MRDNIIDDAFMPYTVTLTPKTDVRQYAEAKGLLGIRAVVRHNEYHLHLGETQTVSYLQSSVADDGFVNIYFLAGGKSLHISDIIVTIEGVFEHHYYDTRNGAIVPVGGTNLIPNTHNSSGDYPDIPTTATSILANPTSFTGGLPVPLWSMYLEAGNVGQKIPLITTTREYIVGSSTGAVLSFKNISGTVSRFSIVIFFVEETPGGLGDK